MPKQYYRGFNQQHATFWVNFRGLPTKMRFMAFVKFYNEVERAVLVGEYTLRDGGYALEPIYHDEVLQATSHGADMTMVGLLASELAGWVFESRQEAEGIWEQIMLIMKKYS